MDAEFLNNSARMQREIPSTNQKALQINLDTTKYGTFAEIGADSSTEIDLEQIGAPGAQAAKELIEV